MKLQPEILPEACNIIKFGDEIFNLPGRETKEIPGRTKLQTNVIISKKSYFVNGSGIAVDRSGMGSEAAYIHGQRDSLSRLKGKRNLRNPVQ